MKKSSPQNANAKNPDFIPPVKLPGATPEDYAKKKRTQQKTRSLRNNPPS